MRTPLFTTPCCLSRLAGAGLFGLLTLAFAGCAGDTNPVRDVFVAAGVGAKPPKPRDFVERSRPADLDYIPPGAPPSTHGKPKPLAAVKAEESRMDALRAQNEAQAEAARQAGATPAPVPPTVPPLPPGSE